MARPIKLPNPNLSLNQPDYLYHLDLGTQTHNLPKLFGDVKFVCMGGQTTRMESMAHFFKKDLGIEDEIKNFAEGTDRYVLYKVGPVLLPNHGIGMASMSVVINEVFKLLYYAGCKDVIFFRVGTCGGIDLEPGTVVVTEEALNAKLKPEFITVVLGEEVTRPAVVDRALVDALCSCSEEGDLIRTAKGKTVSTDDFYEGQGRLDGAICHFRMEDKMAYLKKLQGLGVRNIEMEAVGFQALCHEAGFKAAVVCVTLLDRLKGDLVSTPHDELAKWQERPRDLVARYIKQQLAKQAGRP